MRKVSIILTSLLFFLQPDTYSQNLDWINVLGGKSVDMGISVATDKDGNSYVTGNSTSDTLDFDLRGNNHKLPGNGSNDIFLSKYDPSGGFLWAKVLGSDGQDYGKAVAVDDSGNVFITGYFSNTADFNPGGSGGSISSVGGSDIFIAKYTSDGDFVWAKGIGGSSTDQGLGIATDSAGNVYITGYSGSKTIDFNPGGTGGTVTMSSQLLFLAKYDRDGTFEWVKNMSGASGQTNGMDVAVDAGNNVYITGFFAVANMDFNPGGTGGTISPPGGGRDVFVAKYSEDGDFLWVKGMGGSKTDEANGISVDQDGNVYVAGYIMSTTADFNPGGTGGDLDNPRNNRLVFLLKLNTDGDFQWVKGFEGTNSDFGMDVTTDHVGNVIIAGYFNSDTVDFNPGGAGGQLMPVSGYDVFLAKYDKDGDFYWAKSMGGRGADYGQGVAVDKNNSIFLTGYFYPSSQGVPIDFNPGGQGGIVENLGSADIYLAKYVCDDTSSFLINDTLHCGGIYTLNDKEYDVGGVYTQRFMNTSGCDSVVTLELTILTMPEPVINVNHFTLGVSNKYFKYQWMKDGVLISGATDSTYTVSENADYQVIVENEDGCIDTSAVYTVDNYTGITDRGSLADQIKVFPNPTQDKVNISGITRGSLVQIIDMTGRILRQVSAEQPTLSVPVHDLAAGIYQIKVSDGESIVVRKITKH